MNGPSPNVGQAGSSEVGGWCLLQCLQSGDERGASIVQRDSGSPGQLAELVPVGVGHHGQVDVARRPIPEESLQPDLARCRVQNIDPANDLGDALQFVIDNDRQLVRDEAVPPLDDEVPGFRFEMLGPHPLEAVFEADRVVVGADAYRRLILLAASATEAGVDGAQRSSRGVREVLARAPTGIRLGAV